MKQCSKCGAPVFYADPKQEKFTTEHLCDICKEKQEEYNKRMRRLSILLGLPVGILISAVSRPASIYMALLYTLCGAIVSSVVFMFVAAIFESSVTKWKLPVKIIVYLLVAIAASTLIYIFQRAA